MRSLAWATAPVHGSGVRFPRLVSVSLAAVVVLAMACGNASTEAPVADATPDASTGADGSESADGTAAAGDGGTSTDGATCTTCARDWSAHPPVAQISAASELWVLSDIHGDYSAFTNLLLGAKLIAAAPATPAAVKWTGGTAYLVVVGDLIDKGPDAVDVVRLAAALQVAASAAGGGVVVTMGNHEAEFLADPLNSKASGASGFDPELQSAGLTPAATAAGQNDVGAFLRNLPFAASVSGWFFAHAGKTDGRTIAKLSSDLQAGVDANGFGAPVLSAVDSILEVKLNAKAPQWWDATGDAQALLTQWTSALGVKHLVMGHQPGGVGFADLTTRAADKMIQKYGGLLFLVDTGLSVGTDGTGGAFLHVRSPGTASESFEEVLPSGAPKPL